MDWNSFITLAAVLLTPTLTFIYAVRHDRVKWQRDTRWQVYLDLLEWGAKRHERFLFTERPDSRQSAGPREPDTEPFITAKVLAGASERVLNRFLAFIEATGVQSRDPGQRSAMQEDADVAWFELTRAIRTELGITPRRRHLRAVLARWFLLPKEPATDAPIESASASQVGAESAADSRAERRAVSADSPEHPEPGVPAG